MQIERLPSSAKCDEMCVISRSAMHGPSASPACMNCSSLIAGTNTRSTMKIGMPAHTTNVPTLAPTIGCQPRLGGNRHDDRNDDRRRQVERIPGQGGHG